MFFISLNLGSRSAVNKISDFDAARNNIGASRIGAMVAEEVQNQQTQDKYVTYHYCNPTHLKVVVSEDTPVGGLPCVKGRLSSVSMQSPCVRGCLLSMRDKLLYGYTRLLKGSPFILDATPARYWDTMYLSTLRGHLQ